MNIMPTYPPRDRVRGGGFTMTELMVTVAIASTLLAMAVPSFTAITARNRVKALGSEMQVSLSRARSEAIARNASVNLAPKAGSWQNGWQILDPVTGSAIDDRNAAAGVTISGPSTVTYNASGRLQAGTAPMFVFTANSTSGTSACVSVDLGGRPYMTAASTC